MRRASVALAVLFAMTAALLSGCGGGGETDLSARDVSDEELALMVLPEEELEGDYGQLEPDELTFGFISNDEAVAEADDQDDERQDIERFGRVNGYAGSYTSSSTDEDEWSGLFGDGLWVLTGVELFRDAEGASGRIEDEFAEHEAQAQEEADEGEGQEVDYRYFSVGGIGDEARGVQMQYTMPLNTGELSYHAVSVLFRRGRLLGLVGLLGFDEEEAADEATGLARKLDERIQAVLRGDMSPTPTAAP